MLKWVFQSGLSKKLELKWWKKGTQQKKGNLQKDPLKIKSN